MEEGEKSGVMGEKIHGIETFCEEVVSLLLMAYLFIVFCMYPFYLKHGYVDIGDAKYFFYRDITIGALCLILPLALVFRLLAFFRKEKKERLSQVWIRSLSVTDGLMIIYLLAVLLSYAFSEYKGQALWGEKGWNMGLVTQLLFIASYFLISRFWEFNHKILLAFAAASGGVFILGILNRFSVFPLHLEGANSSFLSTLGNINWYSGYWAIVFGGAVFWYWSARTWPKRVLAGLFLLLSSAAGVSQGSNSAFLSIGVLYLLLFILSVKQVTKLKRYLEAAIILCTACQLLRLWRVVRPEAFDYYNGTLSDRITLSPITLYGLIALGILYLLLSVKSLHKEVSLQKYKVLAQTILLLFCIGIGVYGLLLYLNSSVEGGIRFMGSQEELIFSSRWGSSRGGTWSAGMNTYQNMSPARKLVGAGPDCFAMEAYRNELLAKELKHQFGNARLTNAHNEWLTVLVNNGMLGLIGYAGIFLTAFWRFLRKAAKDQRCRVLYIMMAMIVSYTVHNIVSFQQILSTPFIFLILGIGERLVRETQAMDREIKVHRQVSFDTDSPEKERKQQLDETEDGKELGGIQSIEESESG